MAKFSRLALRGGCFVIGVLCVYALWRLGGSGPAVLVSSQDTGQMIVIELDRCVLTLYEDGQKVKTYVVAVGDGETPSPIGAFRVIGKYRNWGSGFGSRFIRLDVPWGRYGIHGTNKPGSIGSAVSHGCIRMYNRDVEELYDRVKLGTPVLMLEGNMTGVGGRLLPLRPGDRNAHVLQVQLRLKNLGYYQGALDGIFGEGLRRAVLAYRRDRGLPESDRVDWALYKSLGITVFE